MEPIDLVEIDWESLHDAYGAAVDTRNQLADLRAGGEVSMAALSDLYAGAFHQGSYFSVTPVVAAYVAELVTDSNVPYRASLLALLAELSAGHLDDAVRGWDPFLFRSSPGLPDYPEAVDTIEAIRRRADGFCPLLADDEPAVRAASAYLLAGLGRGRAAIEEQLRRETVPELRATFALACAQPFSPPTQDIERAVNALLDPQLDWDGLRIAAELERFDAELVPWGRGRLAALVAARLAGLDGCDAEVCELCQGVLESRLERGDVVRPPIHELMPASDRLDQEGLIRPNIDADFAEHESMSALAQVLAGRLFDGSRRELLLLDELDQRQRRALRLTAEHGLPLPVRAIPWLDARSMTRFLTKGGALDRHLEIEGQSRPAWWWLHALMSTRNPTPEQLEPWFAALAGWTPLETIELAIDLLGGAYDTSHSGMALPWGHWPPLLEDIDSTLRARDSAALDRLSAYRTELVERLEQGQDVSPWQAGFALRALVVGAETELDPSLIDLAALGFACDAQTAEALAVALPEPERSRCIGKLGNVGLRGQLAELADPRIVVETTIDHFLDPSCRWHRFFASDVLRSLGDGAIPLLREARSRCEGVRRSIVAQVLHNLTGNQVFVVQLRSSDVESPKRGWLATLVSGDEELGHSRLSHTPEAEEVRDLLAHLPEELDYTVVRVIDDDLPHEIAYRLQRLLVDSGVDEAQLGGSTAY